MEMSCTAESPGVVLSEGRGQGQLQCFESRLPHLATNGNSSVASVCSEPDLWSTFFTFSSQTHHFVQSNACSINLNVCLKIDSGYIYILTVFKKSPLWKSQTGEMTQGPKPLKALTLNNAQVLQFLCGIWSTDKRLCNLSVGTSLRLASRDRLKHNLL